MKYFLILILTTTLTFSQDTKLALTRSLKKESLRWNFAASSGAPNILSEIQYKDIKSNYTKLNIETKYKDGYLIRLSYGYAKQKNGFKNYPCRRGTMG